jgi:hypothetical protein
MPRIVNKLTDMEYDEISLVDRPAAQDARVLIAKRDESEEDYVSDIYDSEGNALDVDELTEGDVVFNEDGDAFVVTLEEDEVAEAAVGKSFSEELSESISKAVSDRDRDAVISKAQAEIKAMSEKVAAAEEIAKAERDLRLTKEYQEVAKSYNLPVTPEELAPALMAIAEHLPFEVGEVIHKALSAAGNIFDEVGAAGGASNNDVLSAVDAYIEGNIAKSDISKAEAVEAIFDANPAAYDEYLRTRNL